MALFKPDIYQQNIFEINYDKLYTDGIKCLIFDLDNTISPYKEKRCSKKTYNLIQKLKKKFKVIMISNNIRPRIKKYEQQLQIDTISLAMKPLTTALFRIKKRYKLKKNEMVMIGDQLLTDVLSGKLYGIKTCFVEPIINEDFKITGLSRKIEKLIITKYEKKKIFERGKFYG